MERSRKYMLAAVIISFVSQFFLYSSDEFSPVVYNWEGYISSGYYYEGNTGWGFHGWLGGIILAVIAITFYTGSRTVKYYWIALPLLILLGLGSNIGGFMGLGAAILAGYSVFLKRKEIKTSKAE